MKFALFLAVLGAAGCGALSPTSQRKMEDAFLSFGMCVYEAQTGEEGDERQAVRECAEESGVRLLQPVLLALRTPETECLTTASERLERDARFAVVSAVVDGWTVGEADGRAFCTLFDGFLAPLLCALREACDGPRDLVFLHAAAARVLAEQKFLRPSEDLDCSSNATINPQAFEFGFRPDADRPLVLGFECRDWPAAFPSPSVESEEEEEEEDGGAPVRVPLSRRRKHH
ncbi:hypothetical protein M3Y99_01718000 [Aphelenchoides fujianensis]|nr:hypothetical protein M3Y99_01718000 [Aphelenchoides fujianensis]